MYETMDQILALTDDQIRNLNESKLMFDDKKDLYDTMNEILQDIMHYQGTIVQMVILRGNKDFDREEMSSIDRLRTAQHNKVIDDIHILNRIASWAGIPPVVDEYKMKTRHDYAVAAFGMLEHVVEGG